MTETAETPRELLGIGFSEVLAEVNCYYSRDTRAECLKGKGVVQPPLKILEKKSWTVEHALPDQFHFSIHSRTVWERCQEPKATCRPHSKRAWEIVAGEMRFYLNDDSSAARRLLHGDWRFWHCFQPDLEKPEMTACAIENNPVRPWSYCMRIAPAEGIMQWSGNVGGVGGLLSRSRSET